MKKSILLFIAIISLAFIGCVDEEHEATCKTCDNLEGTGTDWEACDNGNFTVTVTATVNGLQVYSRILPLIGSIDDLDCSFFSDLNIEDIDLVDNLTSSKK